MEISVVIELPFLFFKEQLQNTLARDRRRCFFFRLLVLSGRLALEGTIDLFELGHCIGSVEGRRDVTRAKRHSGGVRDDVGTSHCEFMVACAVTGHQRSFPIVHLIKL